MQIPRFPRTIVPLVTLTPRLILRLLQHNLRFFNGHRSSVNQTVQKCILSYFCVLLDKLWHKSLLFFCLGNQFLSTRSFHQYVPHTSETILRRKSSDQIFLLVFFCPAAIQHLGLFFLNLFANKLLQIIKIIGSVWWNN